MVGHYGSVRVPKASWAPSSKNFICEVASNESMYYKKYVLTQHYKFPLFYYYNTIATESPTNKYTLINFLNKKLFN